MQRQLDQLAKDLSVVGAALFSTGLALLKDGVDLVRLVHLPSWITLDLVITVGAVLIGCGAGAFVSVCLIHIILFKPGERMIEWIRDRYVAWTFLVGNVVARMGWRSFAPYAAA